MARIAKDGKKGIERLELDLEAVNQQVRIAAANYCLFRQSAGDKTLLTRLGPGRAAMAFQVVRDSLHQACVMALMRMWDEGHQKLSLARMVKQLQEHNTVAELRQQRIEACRDTFRLYNSGEGEAERQ